MHCDAMDTEFIEGRGGFVAETGREFDEEREMARGNRAAEAKETRFPSDFIDVERFISEGASVTVMDNSKDKLADMRDGCRDAVECVSGDVRYIEDLQKAAGQALARFGKIDCAIGNAGLRDYSTPLDDVGFALDRVARCGVALRNSPGRHTNDHLVSFYAATPSGFEVEFGTGARTVDDEDWSVVSHEKISTWGHVPVA